MNYSVKYLKYKNKYLDLKKQLGGSKEYLGDTKISNITDIFSVSLLSPNISTKIQLVLNT